MPTTIGSTTFPTGSAMTSLMSKMPGFEAAGLDATSHKPRGKALQVREKFQDFAAGTFYKEMLKSLRSGQKESKYFNGGQAEKIFRGQFDQQIAEDMARQHGGAFANPLFEAYSRQTGLDQSSPSSSGQLSSGGGAHALDVVA
jgi:Rod binding domain-containing protein